jgi:hypothetical protein
MLFSDADDDDDQFHAVYQCYSVAFLADRDRNNVENGGKILLPQSALEQLIDQVNHRIYNFLNKMSFFCRLVLCYLN